MSAMPTGSFCWADLLPTDQSRASDFYAELAGWSVAVGGEEYGGYALAYAGPEQTPATMVGGLNPSIPAIQAFREQAGQPASEMFPGWTIYLATGDLDAQVAQVTSSGGQQLMPRMDVPGMGASTLCADPTGAPFGLWQSAGHDGFGAFGEPGSFCWSEVYSTDPAATRDFFVSAFGMDVKTMAETPEFTYYQLIPAGQTTPSFGVTGMPEERKGNPSHFGAYLSIAGVDDAATRVVAKGGTIITGPQDTSYGRMATVLDSEGAPVNLVDLSTATGGM
ncbi:MAG: VOC family protein [Solirubrobacteraceae bacterium]|nr:VOC family protein [Solirubrobacteraceae bacterium]